MIESKKIIGYQYNIFIEEKLNDKIKEKLIKTGRYESIEEVIINLLKKEIATYELHNKN